MLLPRSISAAIDKIAKNTVGKDWGLYSTLMSHWAEIVGEEYAGVTTPIRVSFPKGKPAEEKWTQGRRTDGVLHIKLPQGLVMDFTYRSDQILSRISDFFGYRAIARIVFEPFYADTTPDKKTALPEIDQKTKEKIALLAKDIENDELRLALENLGKAVTTSRDH